MGRTKGSKNKRAIVNEIREVEANDQIENLKISSPSFTLALGFRHLGAGSPFAGLWQMSVIESDGTERVVMDATSKASIINMASNAIAKCL